MVDEEFELRENNKNKGLNLEWVFWEMDRKKVSVVGRVRRKRRAWGEFLEGKGFGFFLSEMEVYWRVSYREWYALI